MLNVIYNTVTDIYMGRYWSFNIPNLSPAAWRHENRDLSKYGCSTSYLYFITI